MVVLVDTRSITLKLPLTKPEAENIRVCNVSATKLLGTFVTERMSVGM